MVPRRTVRIALLTGSCGLAIATATRAEVVSMQSQACAPRRFDPATARALYDAGVAELKEATEHNDRDKMESACRKLDESARLEPAPEVLINLGVCHKRQSNLATAHSHFQRAAELARDFDDPELEAQAMGRANEIASDRSFLTIRVEQSTAGLQIQRDGVSVGMAQLDLALPIDPGEHVIVATAPGHAPFMQRVTIAAKSDRKTVTISALVPLPVPPQPASKQPALQAGPKQAVPGSSVTNFWPWALGGVGATAVVVGSVAGALALHDDATLASECPDRKQCSDLSIQSRRDFEWTLARVTFPVGVVALGTAVAWLVLGKGTETPSATASAASAIGVSADHRGGQLWLNGRF